MATKKSAPETVETPAALTVEDRPELKDKVGFGTKRYKEVGAVGLGAAPEMYAHQILLAYEPGHPEFEAHNPSRYTMDYRDENGVLVNRRDFESIKRRGLDQDPLIAVIDIDGKKTPIAVEGSRRLYVCRMIDEANLGAGGKATPLYVKFRDDMTLAEIDEAHAAANESKVSDDWMTRARKMRMLYRGRPEVTDAAGKVIVPATPGKTFEEIGSIISVAPSTVEKILDPKRRLFGLSPRCQAALADNRITQSNALHFAKVSDHATQDAMLDAATKGLKDGETPDRNTTRALARETKKAGGTPDAVPGGAAGDGGTGDAGGKVRLPRDFRPTRVQLESMKANLKKLNPGENLKPDDVACCLIEYLLERTVACIDRLPPKVQEAITSAIPLAT